LAGVATAQHFLVLGGNPRFLLCLLLSGQRRWWAGLGMSKYWSLR
jgi:hypothetical protein